MKELEIDPPGIETLARKLDITEDESSLLRELAWAAGASPRRALRLLNVYQVIKASLPNEEAEALADGAYVSLMCQVAIATGAADLHRRWNASLARASAAMSLQEFVSSFNAGEWSDAPGQAAIIERALLSASARRPQTTVEELLKYECDARRFSFAC